MSEDHKNQQIPPTLEGSAASQGLKQDEDGDAIMAAADEEGCTTPTSSDHKIPTFRSCPPTPRKKLQKLFLRKRKLVDEMNFFEASHRDEVEAFFRSSFELAKVESRPMKRRCRSF